MDKVVETEEGIVYVMDEAEGMALQVSFASWLVKQGIEVNMEGFGKVGFLFAWVSKQFDTEKHCGICALNECAHIVGAQLRKGEDHEVIGDHEKMH